MTTSTFRPAQDHAARAIRILTAQQKGGLLVPKSPGPPAAIRLTEKLTGLGVHQPRATSVK